MSDLPDYVRGACPNCGRIRLMPHFHGPEGEEKLIGIECEKCGATWPMNPDSADYANEYDDTIHPIPEISEAAKKREAERDDPFGGSAKP